MRNTNAGRTAVVGSVLVAAGALSLVLGVVVGGVIASDNPPQPASEAYSGDDNFAVNENGQTYGTVSQASSIETEPDLIGATGRDEAGEMIDGYVLKTDLYGPTDVTPAQAIEYQESLGPDDRLIPLYESDGETVIGTFLLSVGDEVAE